MSIRPMVVVAATLLCSLSAAAQSEKNPVPPKTMSAPAGIVLKVSAPAHLHIPNHEELKDRPFPLQVVGTLIQQY